MRRHTKQYCPRFDGRAIVPSVSVLVLFDYGRKISKNFSASLHNIMTIHIYLIGFAVLRCLGIPCRPVTAYATAHDMEVPVALNFYFNESGKQRKGASNVFSVLYCPVEI